MTYEHASGLPKTYDRSGAWPSAARMVVSEAQFVQGSNLNEMQAIEARRNRRTHDLVAKDGDRIESADIALDITTGIASLAGGRIYIAGDVRQIAAATIPNVPLVGETTVGVRLTSTLITAVQDPSMLGLEPGTAAEGEPGASRQDEFIAWALKGDGGAGDYYPVYVIRDGNIIDQTPPPNLSGVTQQLAQYDYAANANYIVSGSSVLALGKTGTDQYFMIAAGECNIDGFKRIRKTTTRFNRTEDPDFENIAAEPWTFTGPTGGSTTINVLRAPIGAVTAAIIVKRITEVVTRGPVAGGSDALTNPSVVAIESVTQGGTTYLAGTDYVLSGGAVSWAPPGADPAIASTYSVTYLYNAAVVPDTVTATSVTVSGGVNGQPVYLSYTSKIPRLDLICLDITGAPIYIRGVSARSGGLAPVAPSALLKLAEVNNDWLNTPVITNNGTNNYTYDQLRRFVAALILMLDQFGRSELERDILTREPVSKQGIFTDNFVDDYYRDQGSAQTAAVNTGVLQLAIDDVLVQLTGNNLVTLDYAEEIIVSQPKRTSSQVINPYDTFTPLPAGLSLSPAADFWTAQQTVWTSPVTREFTSAPNVPPGQTTLTEVTAIRQTSAEVLRQINVTATLDGFGVGEVLATLTFDGISVMPVVAPSADANGRIVVTFAIPASVPTGSQVVAATGAAGSFAQATFVGQGTIEIDTLREVTLIARKAPAPVTVNITNVTVIQQVSQPVVSQPEHNGSSSVHSDPLAETFAVTEARMLVGVNFRFTVIGDRTKGVRVQLCTTLNGYPSNVVLAEAFVSMASLNVGDLVQARFKSPVYVNSLQQYAFVIMTADPVHAVAISRLGDVDLTSQERVSSQPYTVGVMFTSSNRSTWTAVQDSDIHFDIVAAKFTTLSKTVNLWTGAVTNISDFLVRGGVEIDTDDAKFHYEIVRADGSILALAPGQTYSAAAYISEIVTLRAVLTGSSKISPVLYPGTLLIGGRIRTTGTYVTRAFPIGTTARVMAIFKRYLPAGATITVEVDAVDNVFTALTPGTVGVIGNGWDEPKFSLASKTAVSGRIRITLNGGPGARLSIAQFRAYTI